MLGRLGTKFSQKFSFRSFFDYFFYTIWISLGLVFITMGRNTGISRKLRENRRVGALGPKARTFLQNYGFRAFFLHV